VPVVAGPAYIENVQQLPSAFTATLQAEPDNRVNFRAVAVIAGGAKVGYLPPEIARHYFEPLRAQPAEVPGRRAPMSARDNTGVDLLLDLTGVPCEG
jgi:hypothetical protein